MKLAVLMLVLPILADAAVLQSPRAMTQFQSLAIPALPAPLSVTASVEVRSSFLPAMPPTSDPTRSVSLAWDPSPDSTVTGYRIWYGPASATYTNSVTLGNVTNATVTGLICGHRYFMAATAFDATGLESDFSNEISVSLPCPLTIRVERFAISATGIFGLTNDLMMTTNLAATNWTTVRTFLGTGAVETYLHTNDSTGTFFKIVTH